MDNKRVPVKKIKNKDDHYEKIIFRMEIDIKKLKAKIKALTSALESTDSYLTAISKDKTVHEIFQEVLDNTEINVDKKCPKCGSQGMKRVDLGYVKVVSCTCGYRNRINEPGTS